STETGASSERDNQFCSFNVGGCFFSIRFNRLSHLQDSLLFKDTSSGQKPRWFIDRDGCTFRHVQYYLQTGKLATSCVSELNILYELTAGLRLTSLLQVNQFIDQPFCRLSDVIGRERPCTTSLSLT
uniref:Potassium channel tetramerisation-type BTB domain-containing protein n=1 Tax=Oncorhynchus kisutch TaxID=8019 RepID=A0A8C7JIV1_ONCKI